ncbi:hypothetical protein niasHS_013697 [Heterodera schachtii]|uniref:BTB domain-containing protein n=1 Tax=Heterodera schachtii TaxID=97005 RepID=A0ABD2IF34_HETSC
MPKAGIAGLKMMGVYADVHFLVGDGDGKELLSAHKHILNYASDVFEAMFRFDAMKEEGENATANCPVVEVPDVEAAAFKQKNTIFLIWSTHLCKFQFQSSENRRQMFGPALFKIRFPLFSREDFSEKIVPSGILTPNEVIRLEQYRTNPNLYGISGALLYQLQFPSHERIKAFGTLLMNIEKVSEFAREIFLGIRESDSVTYIKGLPWKICTEIRTKNGNSDIEKWLGIYLLCVGPKEDQNWSCKCSATVRIVSQKNDVSDFMGQLNERWLNNQTRGWGNRYMISFVQLMDTSNGLYNKSEDKVTVAIDVTVKEVNTEDKT